MKNAGRSNHFKVIAGSTVLMGLANILGIVREGQMNTHTVLVILTTLLAIYKSVEVLERNREAKETLEVSRDTVELLTYLVLFVPTAYVLASVANQIVLLNQTETAINFPEMIAAFQNTVERLPELMDTRDVQSLALSLDALAQQIHLNPNIKIDPMAMTRIGRNMSSINSNLSRINSTISGPLRPPPARRVRAGHHAPPAGRRRPPGGAAAEGDVPSRRRRPCLLNWGGACIFTHPGRAALGPPGCRPAPHTRAEGMQDATSDPRERCGKARRDALRSERQGGPTKKALAKEIKSAKRSAKEAGQHVDQALADPHQRFAEQVLQNAFTGDRKEGAPLMQGLLEASDTSSTYFSSDGGDSGDDEPLPDDAPLPAPEHAAAHGRQQQRRRRGMTRQRPGLRKYCRGAGVNGKESAGGMAAKVILLGDSGRQDGPPAPLRRQDLRRASRRWDGRGGLDRRLDVRGMRLQVWDTAGEERFRAVTSMYLRDVDVGLVVFSLVNRSSARNVPYWAGMLRDLSPDARVVVVGSQADESGEENEGWGFWDGGTDLIHFPSTAFPDYYAVSSKTGKGVDELFNHVAHLCEVPGALMPGRERSEADSFEVIRLPPATEPPPPPPSAARCCS